MRKTIILLLAVVTLSGCASEQQKQEQIALQQEITELKAEKERLSQEVINTKIEKGVEKYVITLDIRQSHFTLDIGQHMKDEMNAIELQLPVDKEYYDSLEEGQVLDDTFRMGSFLLTGSYGSWDIKVIKKEIK